MFILFCIVSVNLFGGDLADKLNEAAKHETPLEKLRVAVNQYLEKCCDKAEIDKFNKNLDDRFKEYDVNNSSALNEQNFTNDKLKDWAASKQAEFDSKILKDRTIFEGCCWLQRIFNRNLDLPEDLKHYKSKDDKILKVVEFLTDTVNEKIKIKK
jgi:hypothetical protein